MKKLTVILALLTALALVLASLGALAEGEGVTIDETSFPSEPLRALISKSVDANGDGVLSASECGAVKKLSLEADDENGDEETPLYGSLKGIELFTNLQELSASACGITFIDVSKNKKLTSLNLSENPGIGKIDVSKNTKLTKLDVSDCGLSALNVKKNTALKQLLVYRNKLKALDVSRNTKLTLLDCSENKLTKLDVSKNKALVNLNCSTNKLTKLSIGKNKNLKQLNCSVNKLKQLDLGKNSKLATLYAEGNAFKTLNIKGNAKLQSHIRKCDLILSDSYYDSGKVACWFTDGDDALSVDYRVKVTAGSVVLYKKGK